MFFPNLHRFTAHNYVPFCDHLPDQCLQLQNKIYTFIANKSFSSFPSAILLTETQLASRIIGQCPRATKERQCLDSARQPVEPTFQHVQHELLETVQFKLPKGHNHTWPDLSFTGCERETGRKERMEDKKTNNGQEGQRARCCSGRLPAEGKLLFLLTSFRCLRATSHFSAIRVLSEKEKSFKPFQIILFRKDLVSHKRRGNGPGGRRYKTMKLREDTLSCIEFW